MRNCQFFAGALSAFMVTGMTARFLAAAVITLPYSQTFDTASTDVKTDPNYPEFSDATTPGSTKMTVDAGGVLHMEFPVIQAGQEMLASVSPSNYNLTGEIIVQADLTAVNSSGTYNVGVELGAGANANSVVIHPGFAGGAFRIEGTGGGTYNTNTNMGYTPANNVFQHMEIDLFSTGVINVRISDSADPINHVFTASYTNAAVYGSTIALRRFGNAIGDGLFDNFSITQVAVPEPASGCAAMVIFGMSWLVASRRGARSSQAVTR